MHGLPRRLLAPLAATLALGLAACGGDSEDPPPPPPNAVFHGAIAPGGGLTVGGTAFSTTGADVIVDGIGGRPASELAPGRIARVRAVVSDGLARAAEVRIEPVFTGRAGSLTTMPSGASRALDVRGLRIVLDDETLVVDRSGAAVPTDAIVPNTDRISVHGFPDDLNRIRATRVELLPGSVDDFELRGFVSGLDAAAGSFELRMTPGAAAALEIVLAADASLPDGLADGSFVEVRSRVPWAPLDLGTPAPIVASSVTLEDATLGAGGEGALEGIVGSGTAGAFVVLGTPVVTDGATVFASGDPDEVAPGARVEVLGSLDADGVLRARQVTLRPGVKLQDRAAVVTASSLQLCGVTVHVDELTRGPAALVPSRAYQVRARRHANGVDLVATRIDDRGDDPRVILQGPVDLVDPPARALRILGTTVDVGAAERLAALDGASLDADAFFARITPGTVVQARADGPFSGSPFVAREAKLEASR